MMRAPWDGAAKTKLIREFHFFVENPFGLGIFLLSTKKVFLIAVFKNGD
jgi:hypothetical protein